MQQTYYHVTTDHIRRHTETTCILTSKQWWLGSIELGLTINRLSVQLPVRSLSSGYYYYLDETMGGCLSILSQYITNTEVNHTPW